MVETIDKNFINKKKIKFISPINFLNSKEKKKVKFCKINITVPTKKNLMNYIIFFIRELNELVNLYKKEKIDIVYIFGGTTCLKSLIAGLVTNKKIIWHIHDSRSVFFIKYLVKFFYFLIHKIIFVSERSKKYYLGNITSNKIYILRSSINTNYFSAKRIGYISGYLKVGIISNINPDKDIITFINVVNELNRKNIKAKFFLTGKVWRSQKAYFEKCRSLIRRYKIKNLKVISNAKDIKKFIELMNIIVCTSRAESFPLSICEAMSMGKPIVSTDVGDIKKFVNFNNRKSGYVTNLGNYKKIAEHIFSLWQNKKILNRLSLNARYIARNNFEISIYMKKLNNLIS